MGRAEERGPFLLKICEKTQAVFFDSGQKCYNFHYRCIERLGFMVAPAWVSDWLPVIQLVGVILLFKYVVDTAAIKMATLRPFLVLDHELRGTSDQILSQSHQPTPATELAEK